MDLPVQHLQYRYIYMKGSLMMIIWIVCWCLQPFRRNVFTPKEIWRYTSGDICDLVWITKPLHSGPINPWLCHPEGAEISQDMLLSLGLPVHHCLHLVAWLNSSSNCALIYTNYFQKMCTCNRVFPVLFVYKHQSVLSSRWSLYLFDTPPGPSTPCPRHPPPQAPPPPTAI